MFVSEASIQFYLVQSQSIRYKGCKITFLHLVVRLARQVGSLFIYGIKIGTATFGKLTTNLQGTLPYRKAQYQLRCMHPTISREIRLYRTRISALNSCFFRILSLSRFTKIYFPIPFYAHLSYLSGIISRNILRRSAFETTIHIIRIAFCL